MENSNKNTFHQATQAEILESSQQGHRGRVGMNSKRSGTLALCILSVICSCTSKLVVQTEPTQADVYLAMEGKAERVKIGQTPLEMTETQLFEQLKITPESSQWLEFTFEKKDYEKRTVLVPSNRWGEMSKIVKINLPPVQEQSTLLVKMIRHFFNAKKFAETRQFDQAHQEIDKALAIDSSIPQAYAMKAGVYFLQNQMDQATTLYKKCLELDPSYDEAIKMLDRIKENLENDRETHHRVCFSHFSISSGTTSCEF